SGATREREVLNRWNRAWRRVRGGVARCRWCVADGAPGPSVVTPSPGACWDAQTWCCARLHDVGSGRAGALPSVLARRPRRSAGLRPAIALAQAQEKMLVGQVQSADETGTKITLTDGS